MDQPLLLTRRHLLRSTATGFGYLALAGLAAQVAAADAARTVGRTRPPHFPARAKRVIFLFMQGGVSHLDTFDYKPRLQAEHGQPFPAGKGGKVLASPWKFAQHGQSGQWISELFPHLAKHADDLCVITTMHTDAQAHETAVPMFHTGNPLQTRPSLGSWTLYGLGSENQDLPGFIAMNPLGRFGQNHSSAFLPASYQATFVKAGGKESGDPVANLAPSHLSPAQQRAQLEFLRDMNERRFAADQVNSELEGVIDSYEMAFRMQSAVPSLMDLERESAPTLKSYGIGTAATDDFGRQCLFARRFAEAGVRFIEIGTGGWDHHKELATDLAKSAAAVDRPIAGLLADLKQRDLLKDTLVVWAGEFGRTPFAQFDNGRDHNNRAFTIWLAGGGVKAGIRHGVTDDYGREGVANRVHIHDLHATILHCLGLDHEKLTYRYSGRDFRLTDVKGNVVKDILA
ncbi:MAG: DUF1501 domain-containing protein [Opitutus sp.]|nr:DUF1501 domain-containing protein [Opitutus sp.]